MVLGTKDRDMKLVNTKKNVSRKMKRSDVCTETPEVRTSVKITTDCEEITDKEQWTNYTGLVGPHWRVFYFQSGNDHRIEDKDGNVFEGYHLRFFNHRDGLCYDSHTAAAKAHEAEAGLGPVAEEDYIKLVYHKPGTKTGLGGTNNYKADPVARDPSVREGHPRRTIYKPRYE
jgi:hypothetical protein